MQERDLSQKNCVEHYDNDYIRNGTACIFIFTEPLSGWRYADAQERRTKIDWAKQIAWLMEEQYPNAKKVLLIMDNLNTHSISSLYEAFELKRAFEIANRLEIHYTPKHGSWLNIAELELSALSIGCLADRRILSIDALNLELSAWHNNQNHNQKGVVWHFTATDARTKPKTPLSNCKSLVFTMVLG